MKKILIPVMLLFSSMVATAQVSVSESLKKHYFALYEQALRLDDLQLAINSLNNVLVEMPDGPESLKYKDTLSGLYFNNRLYLASFKLAQEVYDADPTNYAALGRIGECYQIDLDFKNAIASYEKAAPALKNPFYYYQIAICQYSLKNPAESMKNVDKALADTNSHKYRAVFTMPNGYTQQVQVDAAAYNLKGVLLMDENKYVQAKQYLQQALKIFPDFSGAQQNMINCDEKLNPKKLGVVKPKG